MGVSIRCKEVKVERENFKMGLKVCKGDEEGHGGGSQVWEAR